MLKRDNVPHNVLNAKHHEREAEIVAQAGRYGAVTISTNMAGRGTDIVLGGNAEFLAQTEAGTKDRTDPSYIDAFNKFTLQCREERKKVVEAGGLFVMGTERHEARRIDNQLRGRSGRQGDPGKTRFYISLEDDLMKRFGGERIQKLMERLGWEEGVAMDGSMISRTVESAQKRVEAFHFDHRKHVTEYDDVMNKQRQVVYNLRVKVLNHQGVREEIMEMIDDLGEDMVLNICDERTKPMDWNLNQLAERFQFLFREKLLLPTELQLERQAIFDVVRGQARSLYEQRRQQAGRRLDELRSLFTDEQNPFDFTFDEVERDVILRTLDHLWLVHLQEMDHLREGIGLRGYGQKNPLHEYQREGFILFQGVINGLKEQVARRIYYFELPEPKEYIAQLEEERRRRDAFERQLHMNHEATAEPVEGGEIAPQKDPEAERARLIAQRKARRKATRR